jgi:tetratricopeptide (TPR) repeat protein
MNQIENEGLCPDEPLNAVLNQLKTDDMGGLATLARLVGDYPLDPRLHFLKGSILAGLQRYDEGRLAMAKAVEMAPDFSLARFQLGFLDLTSGRAADAIGVWQPLQALPEDDPLRLFSTGLTYMAADQFDEATQLLKEGMALNTANPLINTDMQLIIDEMGVRASQPPTAPNQIAEKEEEPAPASATHQLLQQYALKGHSGTTKH